MLRAILKKPQQELMRLVMTPEIDAIVERIPKPVGSFGYDPWGYHEESMKLSLGWAKWFYDHYFRVVAHGREHIPSRGRVLIVPNHSGQLPIDGVMLGISVLTNPHGPRAPRAMIERFFPSVPWIGNLLASWGGVIGDPLNCRKMLEHEEAIVVFPEGVRGSGKPYHKRYQLQRFGNGFMHLAMQHNTPIIPVGIVGCEEMMPSLGNIVPLARLLGLPYVPLMPSYVPLPTRIHINFGEPMVFDAKVCDEEEVNQRADLVKERIRQLIDKGLRERPSVF